MEQSREKFASRLGFILISAGCAIGLGNVYRFPIITGAYGGGVFVLIYIAFLVLLGLPIMSAELAVGRGSQRSIASSFDVLEKKGQKWHMMKYLGICGNYLLMIEGSLPTKDEAYCCVGGKSALQITEEAAAGAKAIIAWGNCASAGCVQAANPNPTGAKGIHKVIKGKPIINVQGCPPIADVMAGVIIYMLTFDRMPQLDGLGRPKMFYSRRVHDTCYRRANFDAGLFVESFDDENAKHGYCLYKVGCKGPSTYNSCGIIKWNEGTSYPIQSGHPCLGCSEENFWDNSPFYKRMPDIHGFGIEATADQIGLALGAATAAGIAVHAVATNIRKKELIDNDEPESKSTI